VVLWTFRYADSSETVKVRIRPLVFGIVTLRRGLLGLSAHWRIVFGFAFRRRGKPTKQEPSEHEPDPGTNYQTGYEVHHRTSRVGQSGIDATGE
jgi:hypothetical protein